MPARTIPARPGVLVLLSALAVSGAARAQEGGAGAAEPHYTRRDVLPILFEAKDLGPAGVDRVELWVSVDGGRSWSIGATAEDREEGEFEFALPEEGRYEFCTRTVDRAGNQEPRPAAGTRAHLVAIVDRTPPRVNLLRPTHAAELTAGHRAVVYWEVSDQNLGPRPVRVAFRPTSDDEWEDLPDGPFEANGRAVLDLPARELDDAQVLVEAVDRAGNVGRTIHAFAVRTAPTRPGPPSGGLGGEEAQKKANEYCNRGRTYYKLKQYEKSEEAYKKALEYVPEMSVAHHDLGVVYYARQRYDKAVQHFRAALEARPNDPDYRFSLAVAYFRLGRDADALDHLEQALSRAEGYDLRAEILWTAAMIHERGGRLEEARRAWRRIVEMRGNSRVADARRRLGESDER